MAVAAIAPASATAAAAPDCSVKPGRGTARSAGARPAQKVVLTADPDQLTWKFDARRDPVTLNVVIEATPPLTGTSASSIQITPDAATLARDDRSEFFPNKATHGRPRISRNGERITLSICLDPSGAQPGRYTTAFYVDGPKGVAGTKLEVAATTRSKDWLVAGFIIAFVAVIGVLSLKGVGDYRKDIDGKSKPFKLGEAFFYIWRPQGGRLFTSIVGIVTAGVVASGLYNSDPTWGDDWYQDIVALCGAALAAVGAQGILDGILGAVGGSRND
jgi:hypothetical protein